MATANDIIAGALRLLGVVASGEAVPAAEAADGLTALNQMIAALKLDGIDLGLSALTAAGSIAVPDEDLKPLRHLLAVDIASEYGMAPSVVVAEMAERGRIALQAKYAVVGTLTLDTSLVNTPLQKRWGW